MSALRVYADGDPANFKPLLDTSLDGQNNLIDMAEVRAMLLNQLSCP